MFYLYFWLYTLFVLIIWGFFVVLKIHSFKFKNFNTNIVLVIKLIMVFFIILTITWYILIFVNSWSLDKKVEINLSWDTIIKEISY